MSRTHKALVVSSLYRVAIMLIRVSGSIMAISSHLQGYKIRLNPPNLPPRRKSRGTVVKTKAIHLLWRK